MRASGTSITLTLLLFAAPAANAAPPAAPQVTMGADLRLLKFDWEPVPGATFYRLWVRPGGTRYISVGPRIPASITQTEHAISVHLQNWMRTRYVVTACNTSGCSHSAALNPAGLMLDTIGYLKASNTESGDQFGFDVELSADGYTLAVSAPHEASNSSGVNGNQTNNSSPDSGAVYVFRRQGNSWQQEAYLKAGMNIPGQSFGFFDSFQGRSIAISADGSMLAAGAPLEDVDGVGEMDGAVDAGSVYVYRRIGSTWSLMATLHAPTLTTNDWFGHSVDMSLDARTLKVTSANPRGIPGLPKVRTHIFVRPGNSWQFSRTLVIHPDDYCASTRLSGDGNTLVAQCADDPSFPMRPRIITMKRVGDAWSQTSELPMTVFRGDQPITLNPDASVMALQEAGLFTSVAVYRWGGANWIREATIPALGEPAGFGFDLAFGNNGRLLAIGSLSARERGAGVSPIVMPGTEFVGAAYLYQRSESAQWTLRNVVKSANPGNSDAFGVSIALSASGRTLAVGAVGEDGASRGIDGNRDDESAESAGAAYLY